MTELASIPECITPDWLEARGLKYCGTMQGPRADIVLITEMDKTAPSYRTTFAVRAEGVQQMKGFLGFGRKRGGGQGGAGVLRTKFAPTRQPQGYYAQPASKKSARGPRPDTFYKRRRAARNQVTTI